jgi:hypothetical protein
MHKPGRVGRPTALITGHRQVCHPTAPPPVPTGVAQAHGLRIRCMPGREDPHCKARHTDAYVLTVPKSGTL